MKAPMSSMVSVGVMTPSARPASEVHSLKMEPGVSPVEMARLYSGSLSSSTAFHMALSTVPPLNMDRSYSG